MAALSRWPCVQEDEEWCGALFHWSVEGQLGWYWTQGPESQGRCNDNNYAKCVSVNLFCVRVVAVECMYLCSAVAPVSEVTVRDCRSVPHPHRCSLTWLPARYVVVDSCSYHSVSLSRIVVVSLAQGKLVAIKLIDHQDVDVKDRVILREIKEVSWILESALVIDISN